MNPLPVLPPLPPGQRESREFPRFGLPRFAYRFPEDPHNVRLEIGGDVERPLELTDELSRLPRIERVSDFHCVTTWSCRSLRWGGVRFVDFYEQVVQAHAVPVSGAEFVILRAQDGYRTTLPLEDLLADDVLLADTLHEKPLTIAHGAPLRLVAPAHYGYKSVKHLSRVEFHRDESAYKPSSLAFMRHPRGRVALEERGTGIPGPVLRYLWRPFIGPVAARFRRALDEASLDR